MSVLTLLDTLESLGVQVTVTPGGKLRLEPASLVPAALLDEVRAQRAELLDALQPRGVAVALAPLPEPLVRLIYAASGNHLNRPVALPSGMVMNLGEYVLASAALYAVGRDPGRQLADLWACHRAWAS